MSVIAEMMPLDGMGFPGYAVDSSGDVWSSHHRHPSKKPVEIPLYRKLSGYVSAKDGYRRVSIKKSDGTKSPRLVHRLIMLGFVGDCPEGMEVCHYNGNPDDNRLENLRYDTRSANIADARRHGTAVIGDRHPMAKLNAEKVRAIRQRIDAGEPQSQIASDFGVNKSVISNIKTGCLWGHINDEEQ